MKPKARGKKLKRYKPWVCFYLRSWDSFLIHNEKAYQIDYKLGELILGDKIEIKKD